VGELVFGLVLLLMGTVSALLTRRADRRRLQLMKTVSPNTERPGVIGYAKTSRSLYIALCFILGVSFVILGIVNLVR
jgi:site-specific recombinase